MWFVHLTWYQLHIICQTIDTLFLIRFRLKMKWTKSNCAGFFFISFEGKIERKGREKKSLLLIYFPQVQSIHVRVQRTCFNFFSFFFWAINACFFSHNLLSSSERYTMNHLRVHLMLKAMFFFSSSRVASHQDVLSCIWLATQWSTRHTLSKWRRLLNQVPTGS